MPWYQGNLHCHSTNSDGHLSPVEVAAFYRAIGMDFITLSDHNRLTPVAEYAAALGGAVGIPCCEYTGPKSCHVVAVDVDRAAAPTENQGEWPPIRILQDGIDKTHAAGGVPVLCHPCWNWAFGAREILDLDGATHFELFNASPDCNSYPVGGVSPSERIWDEVLSAGHRLYGAATDDAHWYDNGSAVGRPPTYGALGGKGWCVVKAREATRTAIRRAFEAGRFYATTGTILTEYLVTDREIRIAVDSWSEKQAIIEFVGKGGAVLHRESGRSATYRFRGDEQYVRARVEDTTGCYAFTQPVFLDEISRDTEWTREP